MMHLAKPLFVTALLAGFATFSAQADDMGVRLTYDMSGVPLTISRDAQGTVQLDGLPYPGLVLYNTATKTVYYQSPDLPDWIVVNADALSRYTISATVVAGAAWQPFMDSTTKRWAVKVPGADGKPQECDQWFASLKGAVMAGFNVGDLNRIVAALQWITAGSAAAACDRVAVDETQAQAIGLPIYFNGPNGKWHLSELVAARVPTIALPTNVTPLDDNLRLQLLMGQLGPDEKADFIKANGNLPVAKQVEAIEHMLGSEDIP